ncbi:MAG TPA: TIGR04222 domain-containing membrane protein, partial [Streptomyces sp.]
MLLLVACVAAVVSSARLCLAAVAAAALPEGAAGAPAGGRPGLGLYETAFLAGGPRRVTDTALVSLAGERRVLLAHTGWVTVVDPEGRDDLERSLIAATGPGGQAQVAAVRVALAAEGPVHALGDRLADAGLAVPEDT